MARGTPFHPRTSQLCRSLSWRHWSGYFAVAAYDDFIEPEYAAIRHGAALIDVSPLYKYRIEGRGAEALLDHVLTRDVTRCRVGQVLYGPWCDAAGKVLQEGTLFRFSERSFQLNATEPCRRWLVRHGAGLDVRIEDHSRRLAALALQGPLSGAVLRQVCDLDVDGLRFFRLERCRLDDVPVVISRTGYTGDLGYEIWMEKEDALPVWDALMREGPRHGLVPCGLVAMDMARIEAGFVLLDVDYVSAERALVPSQLSSPYEMGLGWAVNLKKERFIGREALVREKGAPIGKEAWRLVGIEISWQDLETLYGEADLMPDLPLLPWRGTVPLYASGRQVGRATSGFWSSLLKKYVALASVEAPLASAGTELGMEIIVDYLRKQAPARVVELPFFRPERLRA